MGGLGSLGLPSLILTSKAGTTEDLTPMISRDFLLGLSPDFPPEIAEALAHKVNTHLGREAPQQVVDEVT